MRIVLAGYGYYVFGNENCEGGTIFPALCRWALLDDEKQTTVVILVRDNLARGRAQARKDLFLSRLTLEIPISVEIKTYEEVSIEGRFDAAIIAIPEKHHFECINALKFAASEFICVKPVGVSRADFNKISNLASDNSLNVFVDFHKRFDQSNMLFVSEVQNINAPKMWFNFFYGQKAEMPKNYFRQWAQSSNPYQYLAPHFLDLIFKSVSQDSSPLKLDHISGSVRSMSFEAKSGLVDMVDASLRLCGNGKEILLNSCCNWAEPKSFPHTSRQRLEYQSEGFHFISEQDDRGQRFSNDHIYTEPNPHFMSPDEFLVADGYGVASFINFLSYVKKRFPAIRLANIIEYQPIAMVIDFVNSRIDDLQ